MVEALDGEAPVGGGEEGALVGFEFGEDGGVVGGFDDDADILIVFRRGADHGGAADVDVFDEVFGGGVRIRGNFFEGVEIDADEIDGGDGVLFDRLHVFGLRTHGENTAVNGGVEGFDAAIEHFGEMGDGGDVKDGDARVLQEFGGAAGGDKVNVEGAESAGEFDSAGLVSQAQQGPFDLCHELLFSHSNVAVN